jgi:hypothetical protein
MSIPRESAMGGLKAETKQIGREITGATVLIQTPMKLKCIVCYDESVLIYT